jgi:hypothetical protein
MRETLKSAATLRYDSNQENAVLERRTLLGQISRRRNLPLLRHSMFNAEPRPLYTADLVRRPARGRRAADDRGADRRRALAGGRGAADCARAGDDGRGERAEAAAAE